ncbi:META domain-containing protein [Flavobacterium sp. D11R37]|uniref:META domain-containing protein n=1 Tax=Flavobacterium coralii TaxID=2838017 RepID=UPI001CA5F62A|nr:META domain-containing protein [Flavobacterium coralii]MBY8962092.1 META domain-containing protein [Flavobacterium coralii]
MNKILGIIAVAAFVTGCGSTKGDTLQQMLTTSTWELQSIQGKRATMEDFANGMPYVNFTADYKINGKGGCNNFSGSYNLNEEGGINISRLVSTKMYCEGVRENDFLELLETSDAVNVDKNKITLLKETKEVLVLVPKKQ